MWLAGSQSWGHRLVPSADKVLLSEETLHPVCFPFCRFVRITQKLLNQSSICSSNVPRSFRTQSRRIEARGRPVGLRPAWFLFSRITKTNKTKRSRSWAWRELSPLTPHGCLHCKLQKPSVCLVGFSSGVVQISVSLHAAFLSVRLQQHLKFLALWNKQHKMIFFIFCRCFSVWPWKKKSIEKTLPSVIKRKKKRITMADVRT